MAASICSHCGAANRASALVTTCARCGRSLQPEPARGASQPAPGPTRQHTSSAADRRPCPQCGALNYAADDVCMGCGFDLPPVDLALTEAVEREDPSDGPARDDEGDARLNEALAAEAPPIIIQRIDRSSYLRLAAPLAGAFVVSSVALLHGCAAVTDAPWLGWASAVTLRPALDRAPAQFVPAYLAVLVVAVVLAALPLLGFGTHRGQGWPLLLHRPIAWTEGVHELRSVRVSSGALIGLLVGAGTGLLLGILAAAWVVLGAWVTKRSYATWAVSGPGTLLVVSTVGWACWLGLEGLVVTLAHNGLARVWGGVRFVTTGGEAPRSAKPAPRQPVRARVVIRPPEPQHDWQAAEEGEVRVVTVQEHFGESRTEIQTSPEIRACCLIIVFAPVVVLPWIVLRGVEVEVI